MSPRQIKRLDQLQSLRNSGALSEIEFEAEKAKVIGDRSRLLATAAAAGAVVLIGGGIYFAYHVNDDRAAASSNGSSVVTIGAKEPEPSADAAPLALGSHVVGASLVRFTDLPQTTVVPDEEICSDRYISPKTDAGRQAAARGWHIVQEADWRGFTAVLISRGSRFKGSGSCAPVAANVALYRDGGLVGILFAKNSERVELGGLQSVGEGLRVWSAPPESLQGQLNLHDNQLSFDRVTGSDAICGGAYRVPAVFNSAYSAARRRLQTSGWHPDIHPRDPDDPAPEDGPELKYGEVDSCAGTGFGVCTFDYKADHGAATLSVLTYGGDPDPIVSSYTVNCSGETSG